MLFLRKAPLTASREQNKRAVWTGNRCRGHQLDFVARVSARPRRAPPARPPRRRPWTGRAPELGSLSPREGGRPGREGGQGRRALPATPTTPPGPRLPTAVLGTQPGVPTTVCPGLTPAPPMTVRPGSPSRSLRCAPGPPCAPHPRRAGAGQRGSRGQGLADFFRAAHGDAPAAACRPVRCRRGPGSPGAGLRVGRKLRQDRL